jgi:hypothetical protein
LSQNLGVPVFYREKNNVRDGVRIKGYINNEVFFSKKKSEVIRDYAGKFGVIASTIEGFTKDKIGYLANGIVKNSFGIVGYISNGIYYQISPSSLQYWNNRYKTIAYSENTHYLKSIASIVGSYPLAFSNLVLRIGSRNSLGSISDSTMTSSSMPFYLDSDGKVILFDRNVSNFLTQNPGVTSNQIKTYFDGKNTINLETKK